MFFIDFKLFSRTFNDSIYSPRASTTPSYSPRPSTPPSYSLDLQEMAMLKLKMLLAWKDKGTLEQHGNVICNPQEQYKTHTYFNYNYFTEVYNDRGKTGLE
ncbi:hypothetical protein Tco_0609547 [Tanacetum coccineum]